MDTFLMVVLSAVAALGVVALGRSAYQRDRIRRSGVPRLAMITEVQTAALEGARRCSRSSTGMWTTLVSHTKDRARFWAMTLPCGRPEASAKFDSIRAALS